MSLTNQLEALRKSLGAAQADLFNIRHNVEGDNLTADEEREVQHLLANAPQMAARVAELTSRVAQRLQR